MTPNRVKLGCAVTFMKYLASVVSLIFLSKILIWNKVTLPASNSLKFTELVENDLMKSTSKLVTKELDKFTKIIINIVFY